MKKAQGWVEAVVLTAMITTVAMGIEALPADAKTKSSTKAAVSDSGTGTHHGEYLNQGTTGATGASSTNPDKPYNKTSTGRELTGPGTHPGEYDAGKVAPQAPTPGRDSIESWNGSRGDSTRVRGTGPTRPRDGDMPPPSVPETPRSMPGNGNSTLPGSGSGGSSPGSPIR